jgi:hypothetical protein
MIQPKPSQITMNSMEAEDGNTQSDRGSSEEKEHHPYLKFLEQIPKEVSHEQHQSQPMFI